MPEVFCPWCGHTHEFDRLSAVLEIANLTQQCKTCSQYYKIVFRYRRFRIRSFRGFGAPGGGLFTRSVIRFSVEYKTVRLTKKKLKKSQRAPKV